MFSQNNVYLIIPAAWAGCLAQHHGVEVHERDFLQHHGIVNGVHCIRAPCKGTMAVNKNGGMASGSLSLKVSMMTNPFPFHIRPGSRLLSFFGCRGSHRRNNQRGLCRAHDATTRLCKGCCPTAVGMYNATDVRERLIELEMRGGVGRRF